MENRYRFSDRLWRCGAVILVCYMILCPVGHVTYSQELLPEIRKLVDQAIAEKNSLLREAQLKDAERKLTTFILKNYDNQNTEARTLKGIVLRELGKTNEALSAFNGAIDLDSTYARTHLEKGILYFREDSVTAAFESFSQALEKATTKNDSVMQADAWYWQGRVYQSIPDTTNARLCYSRALDLNPDHPEAPDLLTGLNLASWYEMGNRAFENEEWELARRYYDRILENEPKYEDIEEKLQIVDLQLQLKSRYESAEKAFKTQDWQTAQRYYEELLTKDPDYKDAREKSLIVENELNAVLADLLTEDTIEQIRNPNEDENVATTNYIKEKEKVVSDTSTVLPPMGTNEGLGSDDTTTQEEPADVSQPDSTATSSLQNPIFTVSVVVVAIVVVAFLVLLRNRAKKSDRIQTIPPVPEMIGRYRIGERLEEGGMGVVHKAFDTRLNDRAVAIKFLKLETDNPGEIAALTARFHREWKTLAEFDHPNIVSLFDHGEVETNGPYRLYMVMEYVDGISVDKLLEKKGRLDFEEVLKIIKSTLSALEYAHRRPVIHRDLKPSNIMVHSEGWVKVLDFGISKVIGGTDTLLKTVGIVGTPAYMSPEQMDGREIDHRSDIYTLGLILYELLTGSLPEREMRYGNIGPNVHALRPEIPAKIDSMIAKMLKIAPEERYQNVNEILEDLDALG